MIAISMPVVPSMRREPSSSQPLNHVERVQVTSFSMHVGQEIPNISEPWLLTILRGSARCGQPRQMFSHQLLHPSQTQLLCYGLWQHDS